MKKIILLTLLMFAGVAQAQDEPLEPAPEVPIEVPVEEVPVPDDMPVPEPAPDAPVTAPQTFLRLRNLPLGDLLRDGQATASTSESDIGSVANVFDGDTKTLVRSKEINPQETVFEFPTATEIRAVRVMISNHVGKWRVEAATDGVRREIVPWTNAGDGEWVMVVLPQNESASSLHLTVQRIGGDEYVHLKEWELLQEIQTPIEVPIEVPVEEVPVEEVPVEEVPVEDVPPVE